MNEVDKLKLLRVPFEAHQISKLPKGTKAQNDCKYEEKRKCNICGGFHHPSIVHLDYVGHAALTDRLLDADPTWTWEPLAYREGLPAFDETGGLWIKLTVCGVTRLGYGHAAAKSHMDIGAREKEVIGDALRNAAMRFGAALDLWHNGDLHETKVNLETGEIKSIKITPNDGALENVSLEERKQARLIASNIVGFWREGRQEEAFLEYTQDMSNEMKLAVWEVLKPNSAIRTGLKKMNAERRESA